MLVLNNNLFMDFVSSTSSSPAEKFCNSPDSSELTHLYFETSKYLALLIQL